MWEPPPQGPQLTGIKKRGKVKKDKGRGGVEWSGGKGA